MSDANEISSARLLGATADGRIHIDQAAGPNEIAAAEAVMVSEHEPSDSTAVHFTTPDGAAYLVKVENQQVPVGDAFRVPGWRWVQRLSVFLLAPGPVKTERPSVTTPSGIEAMAIVRDLAGADPGDDEQGRCTLCDAFPEQGHTPACPYRRAVELLGGGD